MGQMYSIEDLRSILSPVFVRYGVKRAVLFGSYANACATEKSDLDLMVDSNLRGMLFVGLSEELSNALRINVDVFDVSHIEPKSLIEREIRETGVTLYEQ